MSINGTFRRPRLPVIGIKSILLLASTLAMALFLPISPVQGQTAGKYFNNIVTIVMENEGICNILGQNMTYWSVTGCSATNYAPYMTKLAQNWALSLQYVAVSHPSLPNYLALFSGQTWACDNYDGGPNSNTCTSNAWNSVGKNLVDILPSSVSWKAYMENMTSNCQTNDSGSYAVRHDPFAYFNDIVGNSTRCGQVVPAGTNGSLDSTLLNDLNSANAPNLMWLTPNLCDDMHDACIGSNNQTRNGGCTSASQCVPQGDSYLGHLVPQILSSSTFARGGAALLITFDEGNGYCPVNGGSQDCVYALWVGPAAKTLYSSRTLYGAGHYSWLATIEDNWGLLGLCLANSCPPRTVLSEFLAPNFFMSMGSSSVSIFCNLIGCDPGHTVNSTLTVIGLNQFSGQVNLAYIGPANQVSGVYATGQPSVTVPPGGGPVIANVTAHGSGTTSGTFVWTIKGSGGGLSFNTTLTIRYTWCAHCVLPP